jgi:hypothetical protein
MSEKREEDEAGTFAVPGEESHESEETLGPDEGGTGERLPPSEPKQPAPRGPGSA